MTHKTVSVLIGNTDNKLTQAEWARFINDFEHLINRLSSEMHFFGYSAPDVAWQNCCTVFTIEEVYVRAGLGWDSIDQYLKVCVYPELARLAAKNKQDQIAVSVGETEFVTGDYEVKEEDENSSLS